MKPRKPARSWTITRDDLPSEEIIRRADYLTGLENNAVFRLLTYRAAPFWRRGDFILSLMIVLASVGMALSGYTVSALFVFCASGLIFYVVRLIQPDEAVLLDLSETDLEMLLPTRIGTRDVALGIWGIRTSRRWIASRLKAARIAFWTGWAILLLHFVFTQIVGFAFNSIPTGDALAANIMGMLLIAGGASFRQRLSAAPAHALPACLRIIDTQLKRLEARDKSFIHHAEELGRLFIASLGKFMIIIMSGIFLIFCAVILNLMLTAAASGKINVYIPADLQGLFLGAIAWGVGWTDGNWWKQFVEPDMRRNYMDLLDKVHLIMRRENRHLTHGELAQRFPRPREGR